MSVMQDVFTKAINTTPTDQQDTLREDMTYLRNSWEQLNIDLTSVMAQLKVCIFTVNPLQRNRGGPIKETERPILEWMLLEHVLSTWNIVSSSRRWSLIGHFMGQFLIQLITNSVLYHCKWRNKWIWFFKVFTWPENMLICTLQKCKCVTLHSFLYNQEWFSLIRIILTIIVN